MGRSQESFGKREVKSKKDKKRKDKEQKRQERKGNSRDGNNLNDMIAYVDENGKISSTPPDLSVRTKIKAEDIEVSVPKQKNAEPRNTIHTGIVSFYNDSKGFGFIKDLYDQQSIFFHVNDLLEQVKENNKVAFEVESGHKGPKAVNVKLTV
jgi:cold shock CspA family protein